MKKILAFFITLNIAMIGFSQPNIENINTSYGHEQFEQIKSDYENGKYSEWLRENQKQYNELINTEEFKNLKKSILRHSDDYSYKKDVKTFFEKIENNSINKKYKELNKNFKAELKALNEKNIDQKNNPYYLAIESLINCKNTDEKKQAFKYIQQLMMKLGKKDFSELEKKISNILIEYELKYIIAEKIFYKKFLSQPSNQTINQYETKLQENISRTILSFEKLSKLIKLCNESELNSYTTNNILIAYNAFLLYRPNIFNLIYLEKLLNKELSHLNFYEKEIIHILNKYNENRKNVMQKVHS